MFLSRLLGPIRNPGGFPRPDFESAEQTVAINTILTVAHGLGVKPILFTVSLRNTTGELGYAAGDEITVFGITHNSANQGFVAMADVDNIKIIQDDAIEIVDAGATQQAVAVTTASWRWVIRAWR